MNKPAEFQTIRLMGFDIVAPRTGDTHAIYNPTPLQSFPPSTIISSMQYFGEKIQESPHRDQRGSAVNIDYDHDQEVVPQGSSSSSYLNKLKPAELVVKKKPVWLFGDDISEPPKTARRLRRNHEGEPSSSASQKKKTKRDKDDQVQESRISLPEIIKQEIQSKNHKFLYRKRLEASDVWNDQSRLLITRSNKFDEFLTETEFQKVHDSGLDVVVLNPMGQTHDLRLGFWKSVEKYVLKTHWNEVVSTLRLKEGDFVEVWGYRKNSECRLVLTFEKPEEEKEETHGTMNAGSSVGSGNVGSSSSTGVISS